MFWCLRSGWGGEKAKKLNEIDRETSREARGIRDDDQQGAGCDPYPSVECEQVMSILDSMNAIVYVVDIDTHELLFLNDHAATLLGADWAGRPCHEVLQSGQRARCPNCAPTTACWGPPNAGRIVMAPTDCRVRVDADVSRLERVIDNLLENALKYSGPERGRPRSGVSLCTAVAPTPGEEKTLWRAAQDQHSTLGPVDERSKGMHLLR